MMVRKGGKNGRMASRSFVPTYQHILVQLVYTRRESTMVLRLSSARSGRTHFPEVGVLIW